MVKVRARMPANHRQSRTGFVFQVKTRVPAAVTVTGRGKYGVIRVSQSVVACAERRKVDTENPVFTFILPVGSWKQPLCLIRSETVAVVTSVKCHHETITK